jgi:transposase
MYLRKISRKNRDGSVVTYLQLAHNQRDPATGVVKAQVLHSFGRADELDPEALRRLAQSLLRYADPEALERLRAQEASEVPALEVLSSREHGGLHVLDALWRELSLPQLLASVVPGAPPYFERAVFAILANRALAPASKLGLYERWLETVHLPGAPGGGLRLEQIYRALDLLAEHKERIERALFFEVADLLNVDVDLIFYDTTSVYVEREEEEPGEEALFKWGHSKDSRPDRPQVVVGLAVTRDGLPVKSWIWPGNTTDVSTVEEVKRDLSGWRLGPLIYVADGGMMSEENLAVLSRGRTGYILGVPLRRSKEAEAVLRRPGRFRTVAQNLEVKEILYSPQSEATSSGAAPDHAALDSTGVASKRRRYVLCRNPEEARRQKHRREEILRALEAELERLKGEHPKKACRLMSSRRYGRYLKLGPGGRPVLDRTAIAREEKLDGKWLLITNDTSLGVEDIALGYKHLLRVEACFHRLKHGIDIRPMYHRKDERIRAHVFACVLALLLERIAELRTQETWPRVRHEVGKITAVLLESATHRVLQTSKPTPKALKLLRKMKIPAPKQILWVEKKTAPTP